MVAKNKPFGKKMFQSVVLALIQSVTEFLPVSSSGHLALAPFLFGWEPKGLAFDVALHVGTLGAVVFYFRNDMKTISRGVFDCFRGRFSTPDARIAVFLGAASLPVMTVGFFAGKYIEETFRSPHVIATTLVLYGVLLYVADRFGKNVETLDTLSFKKAMIIGAAQVLALIPGTSRSGVTMTAARMTGMKREEAARWSMLMSVPVIGAAGAWAFFDLAFRSAAVPVDTADIVVGTLVSFAGGMVAVSFLMTWLKRFSFATFAVYRIVLGSILFALL